jgi:hypothetical protein
MSRQGVVVGAGVVGFLPKSRGSATLIAFHRHRAGEELLEREGPGSSPARCG